MEPLNVVSFPWQFLRPEKQDPIVLECNTPTKASQSCPQYFRFVDFSKRQRRKVDMFWFVLWASLFTPLHCWCWESTFMKTQTMSSGPTMLDSTMQGGSRHIWSDRTGNSGKKRMPENWSYWTKGLQEEEANKYSGTNCPYRTTYNFGLRPARSRESFNFILQI